MTIDAMPIVERTMLVFEFIVAFNTLFLIGITNLKEAIKES
jgi:hypothetical protein